MAGRSPGHYERVRKILFPVAFFPSRATTYAVMMIFIGLSIAAGFLVLGAVAFTFLVKG